MDGQVSLLNKKLSEAPNDKKTPSYKVYIQDDNGIVYSTKLHDQVETINDAISAAIKNFQKNLNVDLPHDISLYQLYAAKNGKRDTGLPSYQKTQHIVKVGKERFFLVCKSKNIRLSSGQMNTSSKNIQINFDNSLKKGQSSKEKGLFCFCGGW